MSISTQIKLFHPSYDDDKLSFVVDYIKNMVVAYCNLDLYPTEGTDGVLDSFVVNKSMEFIRQEANDFAKSKNIEGFSESYSDVGSFSEQDMVFLNSRYQMLSGFDRTEVTDVY